MSGNWVSTLVPGSCGFALITPTVESCNDSDPRCSGGHPIPVPTADEAYDAFVPALEALGYTVDSSERGSCSPSLMGACRGKLSLGGWITCSIRIEYDINSDRFIATIISGSCHF
jgi:hypothetical protein